jgi:hypothetical protein
MDATIDISFMKETSVTFLLCKNQRLGGGVAIGLHIFFPRPG